MVVIKKDPNQLYGAVGTPAGLGTMCKCAKKNAKISPESDASITYIGSLFDSNEIEDV